MKVVSPFRPFPPESVEHQRLGAFDWVGALQMMAESVRQSCGCDTYAITDVDTSLPVPTHAYETRERRLMLWILEVCGCYLASEDFDQDTVMVMPDHLVFRDLRPYFGADLSVLLRCEDKHADRPILNGVQWWSHHAKERLVAFYREALSIAKTLPESLIVWGADTEPLIRLLSPLQRGLSRRSGLTVLGIDHTEVLAVYTATMRRHVEAGRPERPDLPLLDFRYQRKQHLRAYFDAVFGVPA